MSRTAKALRLDLAGALVLTKGRRHLLLRFAGLDRLAVCVFTTAEAKDAACAASPILAGADTRTIIHPRAFVESVHAAGHRMVIDLHITPDGTWSYLLVDAPRPRPAPPAHPS